MSVPHTFYVYVLARPNGQPFYVGKGSGQRLYRHDAEARSGCTCHKCNVIRKIWRQGGEVQRYIIFTTNDEQEAYAYEAETIALYGHDTLANNTAGGTGGTSPSADVRAKRGATERATKSTPEMRAKMRASARAVWANPANRAKHAAAMQSPELLAAKSANTRASWTVPEVRAKRSAGIQASLAAPGVLAKRGMSLKAAWSRRKDNAVSVEKVCAQCGLTYQTCWPKQSMYCSKYCGDRACKDRRKARDDGR